MTFNPFALTNKNVLVTGASSGIGRAIAVACSSMGARVIITGRNSLELELTFKMLEGEGHAMYVADINEADELDTLVDSVSQLDGFVSNAGVNKRTLCKYVKEADLDLIMKTNLTSPVLLTKKLLKQKKINAGGSMVFISSIAAFHSSIGDGVYSATKGGISSFSKVLALELAPQLVRVNTVQPAMVRTALTDNGVLTDEDYLKDEKKYPLGRYGKPEEIAYAVAYLLSNASAWVTGTDLVIDGGVSLI